MTHYNIFDIKPVKLKNASTAIRFHFRETKSDGSCIVLYGCLCGLNEKGYWVWPPRGAYGHVIVTWNEEQGEIILNALKNNKILNLLEYKPNPNEQSKFAEIEWTK